MTTEEARALVESDPRFIYSKRYNYNIDELLERYPDGCPDRIIAAVLMIAEEEVEIIYQKIVRKLRFAMGVHDSL